MNEQPNHLDAAIADLDVWREKISTAIDTLRALRSYGGALPTGLQPPKSAGLSPVSGELAHDTFFQMTVPDAAEKYLRMMKTTKPSAELAASLLKGGLKSSSQKFSEMIRTILSRDDRFVRVNTEWGLSEWYPAMRKRPADAKAETSASKKETVKGEKTKSAAFTKDSMKGRTLALLNSHPDERYNAATIAQNLGQKLPSVNAALSGLFKAGFISRPSTGLYQAKKS